MDQLNPGQRIQHGQQSLRFNGTTADLSGGDGTLGGRAHTFSTEIIAPVIKISISLLQGVRLVWFHLDILSGIGLWLHFGQYLLEDRSQCESICQLVGLHSNELFWLVVCHARIQLGIHWRILVHKNRSQCEASSVNSSPLKNSISQEESKSSESEIWQIRSSLSLYNMLPGSRMHQGNGQEEKTVPGVIDNGEGAPGKGGTGVKDGAAGLAAKINSTIKRIEQAPRPTSEEGAQSRFWRSQRFCYASGKVARSPPCIISFGRTPGASMHKKEMSKTIRLNPWSKLLSGGNKPKRGDGDAKQAGQQTIQQWEDLEIERLTYACTNPILGRIISNKRSQKTPK